MPGIFSQKNKIILGVSLALPLVILANTASAAGATLFITPATGTYNVSDVFSVAVKVNTGGAAINAAEAILVFDNSKLEAVNVSKNDSVFTLWVQNPVFSNSDGVVSFSAGKPSPGYIGPSGTVINITFRAKTVGTTSVSFSSGSILANDGKGTNILTSMIPASYNFIAKDIAVPLPVDESGGFGGLEFLQTTTSDQRMPPPPPVAPCFFSDSLLGISKVVINYLSVLITFILLIAGVITALFYIWYRISLWRKKMKKKATGIEKSVNRAFDILREEVEKQIEDLDKKPGLTKREQEVRDKLQQALNVSEKFISKELEDIKKELK